MQMDETEKAAREAVAKGLEKEELLKHGANGTHTSASRGRGRGRRKEGASPQPGDVRPDAKPDSLKSGDKRRSRRPDAQVYVPRGRRSQHAVQESSDSAQFEDGGGESTPPQLADSKQREELPNIQSSDIANDKAKPRKPRPKPSAAVYVPRAKRLQVEQQQTMESDATQDNVTDTYKQSEVMLNSDTDLRAGEKDRKSKRHKSSHKMREHQKTREHLDDTDANVLLSDEKKDRHSTNHKSKHKHRSQHHAQSDISINPNESQVKENVSSPHEDSVLLDDPAVMEVCHEDVKTKNENPVVDLIKPEDRDLTDHKEKEQEISTDCPGIGQNLTGNIGEHNLSEEDTFEDCSENPSSEQAEDSESKVTEDSSLDKSCTAMEVDEVQKGKEDQVESGLNLSGNESAKSPENDQDTQEISPSVKLKELGDGKDNEQTCQANIDEIMDSPIELPDHNEANKHTDQPTTDGVIDHLATDISNNLPQEQATCSDNEGDVDSLQLDTDSQLQLNESKKDTNSVDDIKTTENLNHNAANNLSVDNQSSIDTPQEINENSEGHVKSKHDDGDQSKQEKAVVDNMKDSASTGTAAMETQEVENDDESWDKLFADDGECLDPKLMEELTIAVGQVKVQKPQFDYLNFTPKDPDLDYEAYNHLIEIYDFPESLETKDLIGVFQHFMSRGFDIKWVDDTHAIGVFNSAVAAQDALTLVHPLVKVRPLSQATRATKMKAKRCTEFLQPYKPRPETSAAIARRMVSGALGMKSNVPKEKRDAERKQLKEAKERRKQQTKAKRDAWEGSFGKCAMDME